MRHPPPYESREITIPAGTAQLTGNRCLPHGASGIVVFAHGSGSSRFSARNRHVAEQLSRSGLATLLFDLLMADEHRVDELTREFRFNIPLLAERLTATVD